MSDHVVLVSVSGRDQPGMMSRLMAALQDLEADILDVGQAVIHNELAPDLLTVVIVPNQTGQSFGSLFQLNSAADEIFISGATVDDVSIITALGDNQLTASGSVVTSTSTATTNTTTGSAVSGSTTTGSGSTSSSGSSGSGY